MKKYIYPSIAALFLATSLGVMAQTPAPAAPTDKAGCMKMLQDVGAGLAKAGVKGDAMENLKKQGQKMAGLCAAEKFPEAFAVYGEISKAASAK